MRSAILKRLLFGIGILLLVSSILMLIPRAHGALYPEKPPMGYHFLWTSYLAIAVGLEHLIDTKPEIPEDIEAIRNIEYKSIGGKSLQLDVYRRANLRKPAPLVLFIHGGSWKKGNRADMVPLLIDFARAGYVTATVSYRLDGYPNCVEDVSDAVTWLYDHGRAYGYDAEQIAIVGASAGAHLAMMVAYGWEHKRMNRKPADTNHRIKAVVDIFGPVDLTTDYAKRSAGVAWLIGKPYTDAPDLYAEASPIQYADATSPPTMIIHGTSDELVPNSQADQLRQRLDSAGVTCVDYRYPLWPHAMILVQRVYNHCEPRMIDFIGQYLNRNESNPHEPIVTTE